MKEVCDYHPCSENVSFTLRNKRIGFSGSGNGGLKKTTTIWIKLSYSFSNSYVKMWELGHKKGWALKNWCFRTVALEETLESPLDSKEIKPVNPKGNQSLIFKDWCWNGSSNPLVTWCEELTHWKRPWCWKDWGQEKGTTEDEMVGCHHGLSGHEFEQTQGESEGQETLACCSLWDHKETQLRGWTTMKGFQKLCWSEFWNVIGGMARSL